MTPSTFISPEEEYAKNPDLSRAGVTELIEWSLEESLVPNLSESEAILFLQACYGDLEAAKRALVCYYEVRTRLIDLFSGRNLKDFKFAVGNAFLPHTPKGEHVYFGKLLDQRSENYDFKEGIIVFEMLRSLYMAQNGTANGHILIVDVAGFGFKHSLKVNIILAAKIFNYLQNGVPVRIKGIHLLNVHYVPRKLLQLFKPFIKTDIYNMIHIHTKIETLYDFIPKECLPDEYGGKIGTVQELHELSIKNMMENEEFFLREEKILFKLSGKEV